MGEVVYIYGLHCACHPEQGVRYVGKTARDISERLREHLKPHHLENSRVPSARWISKHSGNILAVCLEECSTENWEAREIFWISKMRAESDSFPLLNILDGGGSGRTGHIIPQDQREAISRSLKKYHETHDNSFLGKVHTEETRARMSRAATGRHLSEAAKEKVRIASTGRRPSEATLRKMSDLNRGERNPSAKITEAMAIQIAADIRAGVTVAQIVRDRGVPRHTVSNIKYGNAWSYVTGMGK